MSERILVIEDEPIVREVIVEVLEDVGFDVVPAEGAERGLEILDETSVALIVSDLVMPGLSGLELLETVRTTRPSLPVVLVTGAGTSANLTKAVAAGANGIVLKPFAHADLAEAVRSALARARATEEEIRDRIVSPMVAVALANAIEARDVAMLGHVERLADLATRIAEKLDLAEEERKTVHLGALLHDVGKIGIPDRVLLKTGVLSEEETALVRTHPLIGDRLLEPLSLCDVRAAVRHHHERWDGAGYPDGLTGEGIPRAARIIAVADGIEGMSAPRPYRDPLRPAAIVKALTEGRGSQWDPAPIDVALDLIRTGELSFAPSGARVGDAPPDDRPDGLLSVLLVEDDADHAVLVTDVIRRAVGDVRVVHAPDVASAERLLADCVWSLAVVDHNLPDGTGLDVLQRLRRADSGVPVLMMNGEGSERLAVEAFRRGASDYIVKGEGSDTEFQARVQTLLAA